MVTIVSRHTFCAGDRLRHASGAIGTDNRAQIGAFSNGWLDPAIRRNYPAFLLVPQFASRTVEYPSAADASSLRSRPLPPLSAAIELVEHIGRDLPIDRSRVYVVGFSMGGSAALQCIVMRPDLFAAVMAIAPVPPDISAPPKRAMLIVHGDADTENPYVASRRWADATRKQDASLEFRTYPSLAHELPADLPKATWWREWLFSKRIAD